MNNTDAKVKALLTQYIDRNNISLPKLAKAAGIPHSRLYRICYKESRISLEDYVRLCNATGEPLNYFLTEAKHGKTKNA